MATVVGTPAYNANVALYGPTADKYANKYGIPTDVFRTLITDVSGFNPYNVNKDGTGGFGGFANNSSKIFNIFDPEQSLDVMGQTLSQLYSDYGDWNKAASFYKTGSIENPINKTITESKIKIEEAARNAKSNVSNKPFWQWTSEEWGVFFKEKFFGFLLGTVGVVFILASVYALIIRNKSK